MLLRVGLVALAMMGIGGTGCASQQPSKVTITVPRDGATEVMLDNHLPGGFQITHVVAVMDGERVYDDGAETPRTSIFHARIPEGDHTLQLVVEVAVPCGLTMATPSEKLTAKIARSFQVGDAGGLVHVDAFAQSAWLHPAERVHLLVSLRGLSDGRWLYGRSKEAREACGRLGRVERSRCVVQRLIDRSRAKRDVAGLLCQKDKLEGIDDLIADLDKGDATTRTAESTSVERKPPEQRSTAIDGREPSSDSSRREKEARVEELEREAEYCVGEDLAWMGEQQVSSDRSACAGYDEPLPY